MNQDVMPGDFNLNITVTPVVGASFYTFSIDGTSTDVDNPMMNFDQLNSGQTYSIGVTATKTTTNIGNFTSAILTFSANTSTDKIVTYDLFNSFLVSWKT